MIQEKTQRLADLAEQLSEALMTAAICADEIRAVLRTELDGHTPVEQAVRVQAGDEARVNVSLRALAEPEPAETHAEYEQGENSTQT